MQKIFRKFWPILFLLLAWLVFASPYFFKGLVPFPSKYLVTFFPPWSAAFGMPVKNNAMPDVITQIYPWKKLTIETWRNGQIPLWNPYSFSGTPHLANYQTAVLSPFNLLFFVFPEMDAWSLLVLLQPLLAGLFMYLFLVSLNRSPKASILGSLAFMFCGFMVVWMAYATLGYAMLWLPLILFFVNRFFQQSSWRYLLGVSLGLAVSFFSGHFQISLYLAAVVFLYILFEAIGRKSWLKGGYLGLFFVLGILLSLPQLLPSFEAYTKSVRSTSFAKGEVIPWQYLITMLVPDFYGNPVTRNDWFGHYAEWAGYIGVMPLLLAFWAIIKKKERQEWFFIIIALVAFLLAYPTVVNDLLFQAKIPVISTSSASRIVVLLSFSLAVLASFGLDKLMLAWKQKMSMSQIYFTLFVGGLFIALWILLLGGQLLPVDKAYIAKRNFLLPTLTAFSAIIIFVIGYFRIKRKNLGPFLVVVILLVTGFDTLRFSSKWMSFDPKEYVYPQMEVISFLQKNIGQNRVFGNIGNELGSYFSIPLVEGYDALYRQRYGEFVAAVSHGTVNGAGRSVALLGKRGKYTEAALQLMGVKYILHRISDGRNVWAYPIWNFSHYRLVYKDEHYEVFENEKAFPRVFLASDYRLSSSDQEIITALFSPDINRTETLILEERPDLEPGTGPGWVKIERYSPSEVVVEVETAVPKLLFLSDSFDPGWQALIDGSHTRIYRADYTFRAVAVPAGKHNVRFIYRPQSFQTGTRIALAIAAALIIGSFGKFIHENRHL